MDVRAKLVGDDQEGETIAALSEINGVSRKGDS